MIMLRRILLFLIVFSPPLKYLFLTPSKIAVLVMVVLFMDKLLTARIYSRKVLVIASAWLLYTTVRVFISWEFSFLIQQFFFYVEYLFASFLFVNIFYSCKNFIEVEKDVAWIGIVQSFLVLFMALNHNFYELVLSLYRLDWASYVVELNQRYLGLRGFGFSGSLTYDLSIVLGFSNLALLSLYRKKVLSFNVVIAGTILLTLAGLFVARSYFLVLIVMLFFLLNSYKKFAFFGLIAVSGLLLVFIFKDFILSLLSSSGRSVWIFEGVISLLDSGNYKSTSTNALRLMYHIDYSDILGKGVYTNTQGGYFGHTDVGYLRHYLFGGIIGLIFMLLFWINWTRGILGNRMLLSIFILMILINFKGDIFFSSGQAIRMSSILFLSWRKR
jgi:hypothetical protein